MIDEIDMLVAILSCVNLRSQKEMCENRIILHVPCTCYDEKQKESTN